MSAALLSTKLHIPPPRPHLISRPRLIRRLNRGLRLGYPLTLVATPAGFGKTTLLSAWAGEGGRPVAWLSLDEGDNDPPRFWAYFVAALQEIEPDLGQAMSAALRSSRPPRGEPLVPWIESLLTDLINDIAGGALERFVLILDDFHLITQPEIHEALLFILDNPPPQMHLVLSARARPPWPLARLRARDRVHELNRRDLRFSLEEVTTFLNDAMQLDLAPEEAADLEARTEGWIAGLQMLAISIRRPRHAGGPGQAASLMWADGGQHRLILDYLAQEVLEQQSGATQAFLFKTSILDRLTAPLCDRLTDRDDSQAMLDYLDQTNLFLIPLDDQRRWYRYHALFADLLQSRLQQTMSDQVAGLYLEASRWYEENGFTLEAINHALEADDLQRVADLIEGSVLPAMEHGELTALVRKLDAMPDDLMHSQPWLCVGKAWAYTFLGWIDEIEPWLRKTEKALASAGSGPDQDPTGPIHGHMAAIRASIANYNGHWSRGADLAARALEYLPQEAWMARGIVEALQGRALQEMGDLASAARAYAQVADVSPTTEAQHVPEDGWFRTVLGLRELGDLHMLQGRLHAAADTHRHAFRLCDDYFVRWGRQLPIAGYIHSRLSQVLLEWNDLEAALHQARQGLDLCRQWGAIDAVILGYLDLARVLGATRDIRAKNDAIQCARQLADGVSAWFVDHVETHAARLDLTPLGGDPPAADAWVDAWQRKSRAADRSSFQERLGYATWAQALIVRERFAEALELLRHLSEMTQAAGALGSAIHIWVLQAVALHGQGKTEQALAILEQALGPAEAEGFVRTFVNQGPLLGELLRQAAAQGHNPGPSDYISRLQAALEQELAHASPQPAAGQATLQASSPSVVRPASRAGTGLVEGLSQREMEVLRLLATGLSNKQLAEALVIAVGTVKKHLTNIYGKLNVSNRTEAVARARELDLL